MCWKLEIKLSVRLLCGVRAHDALCASVCVRVCFFRPLRKVTGLTAGLKTDLQFSVSPTEGFGIQGGLCFQAEFY